jgi:hypothetical protein
VVDPLHAVDVQHLRHVPRRPLLAGVRDSTQADTDDPVQEQLPRNASVADSADSSRRKPRIRSAEIPEPARFVNRRRHAVDDRLHAHPTTEMRLRVEDDLGVARS